MNLGDQIADIFQKAMTDFRALTAGKPDPATLRPKFAAFKEEVIKQLVPIGRRVAELPEADKRGVESRVWQRMREMGDASWLNEVINAYRESDVDLFFQLGKMSVITQYAFFDLLQRQEP